MVDDGGEQITRSLQPTLADGWCSLRHKAFDSSNEELMRGQMRGQMKEKGVFQMDEKWLQQVCRSVVSSWSTRVSSSSETDISSSFHHLDMTLAACMGLTYMASMTAGLCTGLISGVLLT